MPRPYRLTVKKYGQVAQKARASKKAGHAINDIDRRQIDEWMLLQEGTSRAVDPWTQAMDLLSQVIGSSEVVKLYGLEKHTPSIYARRHSIPAVKCGSEWVFRKVDVERLWGHRRVKASPETVETEGQ